jgi:hypothetical protein
MRRAGRPGTTRQEQEHEDQGEDATGRTHIEKRSQHPEKIQTLRPVVNREIVSA